jgi:tryptophanyl-tRNA synthetase
MQSDEELEQIRQDYKSGKLLTSEIKKRHVPPVPKTVILTLCRCAEELTRFCIAFQERRANVTDQVLEHFMTPRPLLCRGVPANTLLSSVQGKSDLSKAPVKDQNSKSQMKKMKKLEAANAKKALKAQEKEASGIPTTGVASLGITEDSAVDRKG